MRRVAGVNRYGVLSSIPTVALLTAMACHAIPAHHLSIEEVVQRPCRVVRARVISRESTASATGSTEVIRFMVLEYVHGAGPRGEFKASYFAPYPCRAPDGSVEAPIHTGSGHEHEVRAGSTWLLVLAGADGPPAALLRVEPIEMRHEIEALLRE